MKYKFNDVEEYFLGRLANLKLTIDSDKDFTFEVALLALCYIDALGNLFGKGETTKAKFVNLIATHGVVDYFRWDKVNLAELAKLENKYTLESSICISCYRKIKQYIEQRICPYDYSNSSESIAKDKFLSKELNDITNFAQDKDCECNIVSIPLMKCLYDSTYGGTLYREYRCESVHKGRLPMLWRSLSDHFDDKPHYVDVQDKLPDFSVPPRFIVKTFEQCLNNLKNEY